MKLRMFHWLSIGDLEINHDHDLQGFVIITVKCNRLFSTPLTPRLPFWGYLSHRLDKNDLENLLLNTETHN